MPEEALMNVIKCLPVLEELIEATQEEVKEALGSPSSGKEPCQGGFPAEILECTQQRRCLHQALRNPVCAGKKVEVP